MHKQEADFKQCKSQARSLAVSVRRFSLHFYQQGLAPCWSMDDISPPNIRDGEGNSPNILFTGLCRWLHGYQSIWSWIQRSYEFYHHEEAWKWQIHISKAWWNSPKNFSFSGMVHFSPTFCKNRTESTTFCKIDNQIFPFVACWSIGPLPSWPLNGLGGHIWPQNQTQWPPLHMQPCFPGL